MSRESEDEERSTLDDDGAIYGDRRFRPTQRESFLKGWSSGGKLEVGANVTGFGNVTGKSDAVGLAVNFKHPNTYTLQFFTDALQHPNPSGTAIQTLAEIIWSVSGNSVRRLISLINGTALSGSGEGVTVKIYDWSANALVKSLYSVGVLLAPGIRGNFSQPPYLEIDNDFVRGNPVFTTIAAAGSAIFQIPQNAGVNSVWFSVLTNGGFVAIAPQNMQFIQRSPLGALTKGGDYEAITNKWWPVSPGAKDIRVFNNTANSVDVTPSWGIEG
jgi:hypothetical protein